MEKATSQLRQYLRDFINKNTLKKRINFLRENGFKERPVSTNLEGRVIALPHMNVGCDIFCYKADETEQGSIGSKILQEKSKAVFLSLGERGKVYQKVFTGLDLYLPRYFPDIFIGDKIPEGTLSEEIGWHRPPKVKYPEGYFAEKYPLHYNQFKNFIASESIDIEQHVKYFRSMAEENGISVTDGFGRVKTEESILSKFERTEHSLQTIKDINAITLLIEDVHDLYKFFIKLNNEYPIMDVQYKIIRDHIAVPAARTGFQSIIFHSRKDKQIEIQLQTPAMYERAQNDQYRISQ